MAANTANPQFDPGEQITGVEVDGQPTSAPPSALKPGGGSPLAKPAAPEDPYGGMDPYQKRMAQGADRYTAKAESDYAVGERELAPRNRELMKVLDSKPAAAAHLEKVQAEPKPEDYRKGAMEFAASMAVVGAIFGHGSRNAGNAALNAFAGAVKGWKEGNLEAYTQATKQWEEATKKTIDNNNIEIEKYREIIENKKLNIDQMEAAINIVSAETKNKVMFDMSVAKNYTANLSAYDKMVSSNQRLFKGFATQKEFLDNERKVAERKIEEYNAHPEHYSDVQRAQLVGVAGSYDLKMAEPAAAGLNAQTLDDMVDRRLSGDKSVITNLGRGAQAGKNLEAFQNRLAEAMQERGMTGDDLVRIDQQTAGGTSYQRSAGTQAARVENASNEVVQLVPQAIETSRALPRNKFVPINKLVQAWQEGTSDEAYNDFTIANFSLMNAYARAMNPTGQPRVTERFEAKAQGILNKATDQKSYEVQVRRLWKEVQASKTAVAHTREGATSGDINAPVPGMDKAGGSGEWKVEKVQ